MTGQGECRRATRLLQGTLPVSTHHERMIIAEVIVHPYDRRPVVRLAVGRDGRDREGNSVRADDVAESICRIRLHPEALQCERIRCGDGLQRIESPAKLNGAEVEQLVWYDRAADPAADLMLRVALPEGRRRRLIVRELEMGVAERVAQRATQGSGATASGRRHLPTGELTARDIVGVRDHSRLSYGLGWHVAPTEEAQTIQRHLILIGSLPRDREPSRG